MFEYLMPMLFQKPFENSLLANAERASPWLLKSPMARGVGFRGAFRKRLIQAIDAGKTYQYKAFGSARFGTQARIGRRFGDRALRDDDGADG